MGSVSARGKYIIIVLENEIQTEEKKEKAKQKEKNKYIKKQNQNEKEKETEKTIPTPSGEAIKYYRSHDILGGGNCIENPHVFDCKTTQIQKADWVWPEGKINYIIGSSLTGDMIIKLKQAIKHFQTTTQIQFYQIIHPHNFSEYVKFHRSMKNTSYTLWCGRKINGGEHSVYLLDTQHIGTYIHEIMHVLGFEHEQCRQDRDEKVIVYQNNLIGQNNKYQYKKRGYMLGQYDHDSIMHYSFTKNIMKIGRKSSYNRNIGQRQELSQGDIKGIKYIYGDFLCTYDTFPEEYYAQPFYECIECWGKDSCYGVCDVCAYTCHEGHELIYHEVDSQKVIKFVCDCGRQKHQQGLCTRKSTKQRYVKQHMYLCFDCFPSYRSLNNGGLLGICCSCMKKCHFCHNVKYYGLSEGFFCDCGLSDCKQNCKAQG